MAYLILTSSIFELSEMADWTTANLLSLNVEMTFAVVFSNRIVYDHLAVPFTRDGIHVQFTLNWKFLGLLLDSKLTFKNRIGETCM